MATASQAPATPVVTVYTTSTCPWCVRAKDFLRQNSVPFVERNIEQDRAAAQEVYSLTGQMGVPVIADDREAIVGFDQKRLKEMAARHARPRLGLMVANAEGGGVRVGGVRPDTVSDRGGVLVGDVVVEMSGAPVVTTADLEKAAARLRFGQPTSMLVRRADQPVTLILRP